MSNTPTLSVATAVGATTLAEASASNQAVGDLITVDSTGASPEQRVISALVAPGSTSAFSASAVNDTTLKVGSVANLAVGQTVLVDTSTSQDVETVTGVGSGGLATTLAASSVVGATNIKVASVSGLAVGDTLAIDTATNLETVTVTSVGTAGSAGTGVGVTPALAHAHTGTGGGAAAVRDETQAGSGITVTPAFAHAHAINATVAVRPVVTLATALTGAHAAGATIVDGDSTSYSTVRWFPDLQNDFAGRAAWSTKAFANANHQPVVSVPSTTVVAAPGQTVTVSSSASDPDGGQTLSYSWWQYREAGTYPGLVTVNNATSPTASFTVPASATPGSTIHMILDVTDNGTPPLSSYARVVVTVGPVTTASFSPSPLNGYYTTNPTVTLSVAGGSAPVSTKYAIDGAGSQTYTGPFTISGDGTHTLTYSSTDSASPANVEPTNTQTVTIDTTPPATTSSVSPTPSNSPQTGTVNGPATVTLAATDAGSGVAFTQYQINGLGPDGTAGTWYSYTAPFTIAKGGTTVVTYQSGDMAGNVEAVHSLTLNINPQATTPVGGSVSSTLALAVGSTMPSFGTLVPGAAQTYTSSVSATVTTTAAGSTLSATDSSLVFTGHLVNTSSGAPYQLAQALGVSASDAGNGTSTGVQPLSSTANTQVALLNYAAPVANDPVTLGFSQPIAATDPLRTGAYSKTITFTLSTTSP